MPRYWALQTPTPLVAEVLYENHYQRSEDPTNWDLFYPRFKRGCPIQEVIRQLQASGPVILAYLSGCDVLMHKGKLFAQLVLSQGLEVAQTLMPMSYVIQFERSRQAFESRHKAGMKYIVKDPGQQRRKGIFIASSPSEVYMLAEKIKNPIVQPFIDSMLFNGRRLTLRLYFLLTYESGQLRGYLHRQGRFNYAQADAHENSRESLISAGAADCHGYKGAPVTVQDLDAFLRPQVTYAQIEAQILTKLSRIIALCAPKLGIETGYEQSRAFQIFGIDVLFDLQKHPWILEINGGPDLVPINEADRQLKKTVIEDLFSLGGVFLPSHKADVLKLFL